MGGNDGRSVNSLEVGIGGGVNEGEGAGVLRMSVVPAAEGDGVSSDVGGISTSSTTWIMPFEAMISALVTVALLIITAPAGVSTAMEAPFRVSTSPGDSDELAALEGTT